MLRKRKRESLSHCGIGVHSYLTYSAEEEASLVLANDGDDLSHRV